MTQKFTCLCIDDEPLALEVMDALISQHPSLQVVKKCSNAIEAIEWLNNNSPQVIFTDINMPGISGIEFAKAIKDKELAIIFTTAHQEYAAEAFETTALDYLLKPISPERFGVAVKRIEEYFELRSNKQNEKVEMEDGHIFVKSDSKLLKISYNEILYVEAFADYVKIWISEDKRIVTLQTMKNMESSLPADRFIRVHRSFIVSVDKITSVQPGIVNLGSKEIPVGKNYKDRLQELINNRRLFRS